MEPLSYLTLAWNEVRRPTVSILKTVSGNTRLAVFSRFCLGHHEPIEV